MRLELGDKGLDDSVLCEIRSRVVEGGTESQLFETMMEQFKKKGLLAARGKQAPIQPMSWRQFERSTGRGMQARCCATRDRPGCGDAETVTLEAIGEASWLTILPASPNLVSEISLGQCFPRLVKN